MHKRTKGLCPICGYQNLDFYPYVKGLASFEICPSCFNQFGHDDENVTHKELRERWIVEGKKWMSSEKEPEEWKEFKKTI